MESDLAERQIDLLAEFLAEHPRPPGVYVSEHIHTAAAAGNKQAKLIASGVLREPKAETHAGQ